MQDPIIKTFDQLMPYEETWDMMKDFTNSRDENTVDEIWFMQHEPVFTQGLAGKPEHILNPHSIPVVQTDRGGQVTYHGPGQLMIYTLIDIKRRGMHTRDFVTTLENIVIEYLASLNISAAGKRDAPGVYINGAKIASIGLRVRKGYAYHGLAFNIDMDLTPFSFINPCGFTNLTMTQVKDFVPNITIDDVIREIQCKNTMLLKKPLAKIN